MTYIRRASFFGLFLLVSALTVSAQQNVVCGPTKTQSVYFGNGIWAESQIQVSISSLLVLKDGLRPPQMLAQDFSNTCFQVAFNQSVSKISDLLETAGQILGSEAPTLLVAHLLGLSSLPAFFIPTSTAQQLSAVLIKQAAKQLAQASITEADIQKQVAQYKADFTNRRKSVVVAHSQGNLFVNVAFQRLSPASPAEQESFAMIPVASPDSEALKSLVGHVTFANDFVIDAVQAARLSLQLPPALGPTDLLEIPHTLDQHQFSPNYMTDTSARKFILDDIVLSLAILPAPMPQIQIDGDPSDWAGIAPIIQDANEGLPGVFNGQFLPGLDILEVSVTNDATNVYFLVKVVPDSMRQRPEYPFDPIFLLFLDTDLNSSTGCRGSQANGTFGPFVNVGYEGLIRVSFTSPASSFIAGPKPSSVPSCFASPADFPGAVKVAATPGYIELSIPRSVLKTLTANTTAFDFYVQAETDWTRQIRYALK